MLEPGEDPRNRKLIYRCNTCKTSKVSKNPCVQLKVLKKNAATSLDLIDTDLVDDKTLPRKKGGKCEKCEHDESVSFMPGTGGKDSDMAMVFICTSCRHKWLS